MKVKLCKDCVYSFELLEHGSHESKTGCKAKNLPCNKVQKCPLYDLEDFELLLNHWEDNY